MENLWQHEEIRAVCFFAALFFFVAAAATVYYCRRERRCPWSASLVWGAISGAVIDIAAYILFFGSMLEHGLR